MSLGFFVLKALFWDTLDFFFFVLGFFQTVFFVFRKNLSQKEERSTEKTTKTPTFTPLDVSSISDRSNGCGRAFCLLLSLSLFCKGEEEEEKTCRR